MNNTHLVFISHSSKDVGLAIKICRYLEDRGVNCWIASRDIKPGSNYAGAIMEGIRNARVLLVILSKHANDSTPIANEVERAFHEKLVILPFRIESFGFSPSLEFFLSTAQAMDATIGRPEDYFERLYLECFVLTNPGAARPLFPMVKAREKSRKWLVVLVVAGGMVVVFCLYFAAGQKAVGPATVATRDTTTTRPTVTTVDSGVKVLHDSGLRPSKRVVATVAVSSQAIKALDGAVFIDGPTPADVKSENQISFSSPEGNEIGFQWVQSHSYTILGKMRLKGNTLEVVTGDASGALSLIDQGTRIRGNLEVKSSGAPFPIDLTRAP